MQTKRLSFLFYPFFRAYNAGETHRAAPLVLLLSALLISGCTYKDRVQPVTLPAAAGNMVTVDGLSVSADAYTDQATARAAFGFDIRKAGLLPVQLSFQNEGTAMVSVIPDQTFLIDDRNQAWPISSRERTYSRIEKHVDTGAAVAGAGKPALLMGAAGAVAGLAIGIVTGENIAESMGKGAAIGAAAGAIGGGAKGYADARSEIQRDLRSKSLENKQIRPNQIAYGVLFFPGYAEEATDARQLKLSLSFDGVPKTFNIDLTQKR